MQRKSTSARVQMHARNLHRQGYDFKQLSANYPALSRHLLRNPSGGLSIDFREPLAVKALNAALLKTHYGVETWDVPAGYLCPPVPGRADYIHHIADLLAESNQGDIPLGNNVMGLDIGVGANVIYPIIGSHAYDWSFVGSELDKLAFESASRIVDANPRLKKQISIRHQSNPENIFNGLITPQDQFAFTLCNPPFHASAKEAAEGSQRKTQNLARHSEKRHGRSTNRKNGSVPLNFGGQHTELWCKGGEWAFVRKMIEQSVGYQKQVGWFTCLVSKKDNLDKIQHLLGYLKVEEVRIVNMSQGSKSCRFVAWRF